MAVYRWGLQSIMSFKDRLHFQDYSTGTIISIDLTIIGDQEIMTVSHD